MQKAKFITLPEEVCGNNKFLLENCAEEMNNVRITTSCSSFKAVRRSVGLNITSTQIWTFKGVSITRFNNTPEAKVQYLKWRQFQSLNHIKGSKKKKGTVEFQAAFWTSSSQMYLNYAEWPIQPVQLISSFCRMNLQVRVFQSTPFSVQDASLLHVELPHSMKFTGTYSMPSIYTPGC